MGGQVPALLLGRTLCWMRTRCDMCPCVTTTPAQSSRASLPSLVALEHKPEPFGGAQPPNLHLLLPWLSSTSAGALGCQLQAHAGAGQEGTLGHCKPTIRAEMGSLNGLGWNGPQRLSHSYPCHGTPSPRPGCSEPHPTWPEHFQR